MVSAGRQEEDSELQGRSLPSLGLDPKPADDNYPTGSFEVLLERLGSFGPYQIRTFILTSLLDLPACWVAMFFLFGGYNPGFVCVSQAGKALVDNGTFSVTTAPNDTWGADQCQVNGSDCVAIIFNEDYHSALTEWSLVCRYKYINNFFTTVMMVGILVGASVFGHLADLYGRRHVLYGSVVLLLLSLYLQGLSANWQMFVALRFTGGMAVAGIVCAGYVLPMEMIGPQWRTVCGCVGFWQLATIIFTGLAYLIPHWRHLSFTAAALATPLLFAWFIVPESPRWLIQQNRLQEALVILRQMARCNGRPEPSEKDLLQLERRQKVTSSYSIRDMFRTRTLTTRTVLMAYTWFMCNIATYGLAIGTRDMGGNIYINIIILSITEFFFCTSVIFMAKRFGRRPTLLGYETIGAICLFLSIGLKALDVDRTLVGTVSAIGRASVMATWYIAYLLTAELFPTLIRSLANGSCSVFGRIGGILAPQVAFSSVAYRFLPDLLYGTFILVAIVSAAIFIPETKGKPLPDVFPPHAGCCTEAPPSSDDENEVDNFHTLCPENKDNGDHILSERL